MTLNVWSYVNRELAAGARRPRNVLSICDMELVISNYFRLRPFGSFASVSCLLWVAF